MVRVLCSTNYCTLLDAQHCRDRQTIATLRWENEALVAQVRNWPRTMRGCAPNGTRRGLTRTSTWRCSRRG